MTKKAIELYIRLSKECYTHDAIVNIALRLMFVTAFQEDDADCTQLRQILRGTITTLDDMGPPSAEFVNKIRAMIDLSGGVVIEVSLNSVKDGRADPEQVRMTMEGTKGNA